MSHKLITWAGAFVAVVGLTLATSQVEARQCRSQRSRCCGQSSNCGYGNGYAQSSNCGYQTSNYRYQQTTNCGYRNGCGNGYGIAYGTGYGSRYGNGWRQTARYVSTGTACCTPQSTWQSGQPAAGTAPGYYNTPTPAGDSMPPTPIAAPPAPAPGA